MKLKAQSTTKIVTLEMKTSTPLDTGATMPARVWEAETKNGVRCHLYVTRIAVADEEDQSEFKAELEQHEPPTVEIQAIPIRLII